MKQFNEIPSIQRLVPPGSFCSLPEKCLINNPARSDEAVFISGLKSIKRAIQGCKNVHLSET
jgi:hypothetical protein